MDIIVVDPNGNQRKYNIEAFQKEVVSFGRQPDNDIVFNYDFVSRVHGVIYREGMQYYEQYKWNLCKWKQDEAGKIEHGR